MLVIFDQDDLFTAFVIFSLNISLDNRSKQVIMKKLLANINYVSGNLYDEVLTSCIFKWHPPGNALLT